MEPTLAVYFEQSPIEVVSKFVIADPPPSQGELSSFTGALVADPFSATDVRAWSDDQKTRVIAVYFDNGTFEFQLAINGELKRHLKFEHGSWAIVEGQPEPWEAPSLFAWFKLCDELKSPQLTDAALVRKVQQVQAQPISVDSAVPNCSPVHAMLAVAAWYGLEKPD